MIKLCQAGCICDYITLLIMLLKNALSLSISARYNKNGVMTGTM